MRHVLVVDDDDAIRALLQISLEAEGYMVTCLSNGADALVDLWDGPCGRLILLDLLMPGIDGRAVYQALAGDPVLMDDHRLVMMSASVNFHTDDFPLASALLRKPFELAELLSIVGQLAAA